MAGVGEAWLGLHCLNDRSTVRDQHRRQLPAEHTVSLRLLRVLKALQRVGVLRNGVWTCAGIRPAPQSPGFPPLELDGGIK
eukprot:gene13106-biopygen4380